MFAILHEDRSGLDRALYENHVVVLPIVLAKDHAPLKWLFLSGPFDGPHPGYHPRLGV